MTDALDRRSDSLLRIAEVKRRTGLSTATIYRRVDDGTFPPKQRIGPKCVAWYESDVNAFVANPMNYRELGGRSRAMTPATCRAARGLLGLTQAQLAAAANVGLSTVKSYEDEATPTTMTIVTAIQEALERAGVEFLADGEPSDSGGAGVRLAQK